VDTLSWVRATASAGGPTADVNVTNASLAVTGPLTDAQLRATSVPVSGTVTANAGTNLDTSALALEATLQSIRTAVETLDNYVSGSRALVTEDNSAAIRTAVETIDNFLSGSRGLVTEDNSAAILSALGSILAALASVPVTGPLTDAELRASTVSVGGLVSDARESYQDGQTQPFSLTTDGRVRVSASPALVELEHFLPWSATGAFAEDRVFPHVNPWG
jgi:hypothetical protein